MNEQLLGALKILGKEPVDSGYLKEAQASESVVAALKSRNIEELQRALVEVGKPVSRLHTLRLRDEALSNDWPRGFDAVFDHFGFDKKVVKAFKGQERASMLETLASRGWMELLDHVWASAPEKDKEECRSHYMCLAVAGLMIRHGEGWQLHEGLDLYMVQNHLKNLIPFALSSIKHSVDVEDDDPCEEAQNALLVLKEILVGAGPKLIESFWDELSEMDSAKMVKELVKNGVITERTLSITIAPEKLLGEEYRRRHIGHMDRIPSKWIEANAGQENVVWSQEAQSVHTFTFHEIMCLESREPFSLLGHLVANRGFANAVVESDVARHALVVSTSVAIEGVGIYEEMQSKGVDLSRLVCDGGKNPMHYAVARYGDTAFRPHFEHLRRLLELYPAWANAVDFEGRRPLDYARVKSKDEVSSLIEQTALKEVLEASKNSLEVKKPRL